MTTAAHPWNPADYAKHSQGQERWAKELIDLLALRRDERVLDLGCGDGRHTTAIAALVPNGTVVGVDRSAEMVEFAQAHYPTARFANLSFFQADASALPFDAEFDVVFSNAVLHWVIDHRPVLTGISRSLRRGGRCLLQMGGKGNGDEVTQAMDACLSDDKWQAKPSSDIPYGFYGVEEYRSWLQAAGLKPDSVELIEKDMIHENVAAFTGWLRTAWHPYTTRVAQTRRDQFIEAATDYYLRRHPADGEGRVHVRMNRLQVAARKI